MLNESLEMYGCWLLDSGTVQWLRKLTPEMDGSCVFNFTSNLIH
jgi:hypothetical protein